MSSFNAASSHEQVAELRRIHRQRMTRTFVVFGTIEVILLVTATIVVYGLEIVPFAQSEWIIVAIAAVGGLILSALVLSLGRRNARELRELGVDPRSGTDAPVI